MSASVSPCEVWRRGEHQPIGGAAARCRSYIYSAVYFFGFGPHAAFLAPGSWSLRAPCGWLKANLNIQIVISCPAEGAGSARAATRTQLRRFFPHASQIPHPLPPSHPERTTGPRCPGRAKQELLPQAHRGPKGLTVGVAQDARAQHGMLGHSTGCSGAPVTMLLSPHMDKKPNANSAKDNCSHR